MNGKGEVPDRTGGGGGKKSSLNEGGGGAGRGKDRNIIDTGEQKAGISEKS